MKKIIQLMLFWVSTMTGQAQSIFNQKAGQIKNLVQQVALLHVYIGYVEKGYAIAKDGLTTISDIKNGDLLLHRAKFSALEHVNPVVKKYAGIADIILQQKRVVSLYHKTMTRIRNSDLLSGEDTKYVTGVFNRLLSLCAGDMDELIKIISTGSYQMTDDERIHRINTLKISLTEKNDFANHFAQTVEVLCLQKTKEQHGIQTNRNLRNIKNP